jgi:hypothetical protein
MRQKAAQVELGHLLMWMVRIEEVEAEEESRTSAG